MNNLVVNILLWTLLPGAAALISYLYGAMHVGLDLLPKLPQEFHHRSWGLRILRHEGVIEFEVGWIGRLSRCIRRPR
jgi:hypothetical protein